MSQTWILRCFVLGCALLMLISCGKKETPEQQLARVRLNHEIIPVGTVTLKPDTDPVLVVDMQIINQGTERLDHLTVLVRVVAADGLERLKQTVTLDLAGVRPGVGERRSAMIGGFILDEGDQVFVELESDLSPEDLRALPEFGDLPLE